MVRMAQLPFCNLMFNVMPFVPQLLESVWIVLKGNINLCITLLTTGISFILGGGTALLNFIISIVSTVEIISLPELRSEPCLLLRLHVLLMSRYV